MKRRYRSRQDPPIIGDMEWKQPEGLRRRWIIEEIDAELMFAGWKQGAALGRVDDACYDLHAGGLVRPVYTIASDGHEVATMTMTVDGGSGTVQIQDCRFTWRAASLLSNKFVLQNSDGQPVFSYTRKSAIGLNAGVHLTEIGRNQPKLQELLLLSWFVFVNANPR